METKKCSLCKKTKLSSEFYSGKKYLYSHCKVCKRHKDKNSYHTKEKERESRKARDKKSHKIRQLKAQIYVYDILSKSKCIDCGEDRLETLDYDHVRGTKTKNISKMIAKGQKIEDIKNEISLCDIRCANCHRVKTFKQLDWSRADWNTKDAERQLDVYISQAPKRKPSSKRMRRKSEDIFSDFDI